MRPPERMAALAAALALGSCATSALDMAPDRPDKPWTPATTAAGEPIAGAPGVSGGGAGYVLPPNPALRALPASPEIDSAKTYTLPQLIDLAESTNPATRVAWNDARRSALAAGVAESAYLPRVSASVVGGYQATNGSDSTAGVNLAGAGSSHGAISVVSVEWLLFDFGERAAVVEAAKQASFIADVAFTAAHQQVIYEVSLAYYRCQGARARFATAKQSLANALAVEAAAEERFRRGVGTVVESDQTRQATAQARLALVQAEGGARDAYVAVLSAVGLSPLTTIRIADTGRRTFSPSMLKPVEGVIAAAIARRPDIQSAYAAQKAAVAKVRATEAEFLPKVFTSATGSYNPGSLDVTALPGLGAASSTVNINNNRLGAAILAGVTVPVYDGGTREAALKQAEADADSAGAKFDQIRNDAVRQIVVADNALRTGLAAVSAASALVSASQTTFDAALAAYRNGVGSITDATIAETQLLQAKLAYADSTNAVLTAAATLALATGALGGAPG
ncbi:outer membrane protein TolC [Roseiarcus fermentans]|uniref:Protein CyaE n=1 Tax=Roseiarcus fermentans TaxID=1473586 RepID=A0A366F268_9HYPH|nr:TolC family protein [Roseiarcus fermentans]RBP08704.1 outer membrane protein TolC [Roseiarcus fermentans]